MNKRPFQHARSAQGVCAIFLLCALLGCVPSEMHGAPSEIQADLQAIVDDAVMRGATVGAVIEVSDKHAVASVGGGLANLEDGSSIIVEDHFRGGSILKTFVATAVLQAVEAGKLKLDDRITKHLGREITGRIAFADSIDIRMLLGHRSGIGEWETPDVDQRIGADPGHVWTLDEMLDLVAKNGPAFRPGVQYGYSNTNYELLGEILTRVHGADWRSVLSANVFERAGLRHTRLPRPGDHACAEPCAHGYIALDSGLRDFSDVDPSMAGAAGGHALITTAADLTRFFTKLRSGALFAQRKTLDAMFDFADAPEPETYTVGYGFGVAKFDVGGLVAYGHLGGTAGYQSFMLYVPATQRYLTGFVNQQGSLTDVLGPALARVAMP